MSQDRPKVSPKKIVFKILSVVCLIALVVGGVYVVNKSGDVGGGLLAIVGVYVVMVIFLNHSDELINSGAPSFRLLLLFASLVAWSILVPFPIQGIFGGIMTALSFGAIACLAEFFWSFRHSYRKAELFTPIFWTALLLASYVDHIIEGPWSSVKIILIGARGALLIGLFVALVGRLRSKWATCLSMR